MQQDYKNRTGQHSDGDRLFRFIVLSDEEIFSRFSDHCLYRLYKIAHPKKIEETSLSVRAEAWFRPMNEF
jgi:hypothetical protein